MRLPAWSFHALDLDHAAVPGVYAQPVDTSGQRKVERLFELRVRRRIPSAYLTYRTWFAGLEFYVDERVLIPRSPSPSDRTAVLTLDPGPAAGAQRARHRHRLGCIAMLVRRPSACAGRCRGYFGRRPSRSPAVISIATGSVAVCMP